MNTCFSDIVHEIKQLQMKVLDFVEKEKMDALGKLGSSIQQSHNRLLKLEGNSVWLHTLLTNRSDEQFLQARPHHALTPSQPPWPTQAHTQTSRWSACMAQHSPIPFLREPLATSLSPHQHPQCLAILQILASFSLSHSTRS